MDRLSKFLVNVSQPELAPSNIYQVVGSAIRLVAANLAGLDVVTIQVLVGDNSNGVWQDLFRCGQPVRLTAIDNQLTEVVGGKYRAVYAGVADVKVWAETNDVNLDKNVVYNYSAACCGSGSTPGDLSVLDTNSVNLTLVGNVLAADVNISADAGNTLEIRADGLYGTVLFATVATAVDYVALPADEYIGVTDTSVARTITLPTVVGLTDGKIYKIKDESGGAATNNITVTPQLGEFIDGAASSPINLDYGAMEIILRNGAWWIT